MGNTDRSTAKGIGTGLGTGTGSGAGFVWGASTSSYQIEGAINEDGRAPSIWDTYCLKAGKVANGESGDIACDHYHRFEEDIALMKDLGLKAYRFSVAWPRVIPDGDGARNEKGLAFYDRLIDGLLAAGIEPWLCLYHWDLPLALDARGGWLNRDIASWFADYAALVASRYGDRVKRFSTFNEPGVFSLFGYAFGWQAPDHMDRRDHLTAIHHVNLSHGAAVDALRAHAPGAQLGCIHNVQPIIASSESEADRNAAAMLDLHWNKAFPDAQILGAYPEQLARDMAFIIRDGDLDRIRRPIDWFGLNHYSPIYARADSNFPHGYGWGSPPAGSAVSANGWPIHPEAFRDTLKMLSSRYKLPIYVTENGAGGKDSPDHHSRVHDQHRIDYLKAYLAALAEAVQQGADVRGYFVWSLLDNFEWGAGYSDRFGIVYVDYPTLRRMPKDSARWYSAYIADHPGMPG